MCILPIVPFNIQHTKHGALLFFLFLFLLYINWTVPSRFQLVLVLGSRKGERRDSGVVQPKRARGVFGLSTDTDKIRGVGLCYRTTCRLVEKDREGDFDPIERVSGRMN